MSELKISGCLKLIKIKDLWLLFAYQVIITDHYKKEEPNGSELS
jgi:hypothetical protein